MWQQFFKNGDQLLRIFIARLGFLAVAVKRTLNHGQIGQCQFGHNRFNIGNRIYPTRYVHDVFIIKTTHDVNDGIGFTDVGQKLVAKTFTLGGTRYKAGDIDKFNDGWLYTLRLNDF